MEQVRFEVRSIMMPKSKTSPAVSTVMTRDVRTAGPDRPLEEILEILRKERCHHVPIVEGKRPIGMISARDLRHLVRRQKGEQYCIDLNRIERAGDAMTENLVQIHVDESVDTAIERIGRGDIHALVVVDDDGNLEGIVTHHDLLDYLLE